MSGKVAHTRQSQIDAKLKLKIDAVPIGGLASLDCVRNVYNYMH